MHKPIADAIRLRATAAKIKALSDAVESAFNLRGSDKGGPPAEDVATAAFLCIRQSAILLTALQPEGTRVGNGLSMFIEMVAEIHQEMATMLQYKAEIDVERTAATDDELLA